MSGNLTAPPSQYIVSLTVITAQQPCASWMYNALKNGVDGTLPPTAMGECTLNGASGWYLRNLLIHKDKLRELALAIINKSSAATGGWPRTEYIFAKYRYVRGSRFVATKDFRDMETEISKAKYSSPLWQSRTNARISLFDRNPSPQRIITMFADPDITSPPVTLEVE